MTLLFYYSNYFLSGSIVKDLDILGRYQWSNAMVNRKLSSAVKYEMYTNK
jgi:hypothetical protein